MKTVFGLLRHGTTLWNEEKRIQGRKDSPLSSRGRELAASWARFIEYQGWQRIIASDLGRVKETVAIMNTSLHLPVTFDERLRELDWGEWEGQTMAEVAAAFPGELERLAEAGWNFRPPGGESRIEVLYRARAALAEHTARRPGEKLLVVCHLGVIKCLVLHCLNNSFLPEHAVPLQKDALHILAAADDVLSCVRLNIPCDDKRS